MREQRCPLLIVRGISDIVQYPRNNDWKLYACKVVARFARDLVNLGAVETIVGSGSGNQTKLQVALKL